MQLYVGCEQGYKPSSVLDSHLSWHTVASTLMRRLPEAGRAAPYASKNLVLRQVGFTEPSLSPTKR